MPDLIRNFTPPLARLFVLAAAIVVLIAFALLAGGGPALAHDPYGGGGARAQQPGVDLVVYGDLNLDVDSFDRLFVANDGTVDAFGVRVVIEYGPDFYGYETSPNRYAGSSALTGGSLTSAADNPAGLIWEIPRLPAKSTHSLPLRVPVYDSRFDSLFTNIPYVVVATVSSDSVEAESKLGNNRVEIWQRYRVGRYNQFEPQPFSVAATVDNQVPQPGENIVFNVVALYDDSLGNQLSDTVVEVQLTPGLAYTESSAATRKLDNRGDDKPEHNFSAYTHYPDDNAGRWEIGPFVGGSFHLELTATVDADAGGSEQCLTAEISARPGEPLGANGVNHSLDNIARICVQPRQPDASGPAHFSAGDVTLFTWYDCVGQGAYPCAGTSADNNDQLQLAVVPRIITEDTPAAPEEVRQPGDVIVHVSDPLARRISNGQIVWSTGFADPFRPGVRLDDSFPASANWDDNDGDMDGDPDGEIRIEYTVPSGGEAVSYWDVGEELWGFDTGNQYANDDYPLFFGPFFTEFTRLGRYQMRVTIGASHDSGTPGDESDDVEHSDTETYTFHVGPMADLAVHSVWETAQGVTVAVANLGPDPSPGGRVMLNGESCDFGHLHPNSEIATCTFAGAQLAGTDSVGTIEDNVKYGACIVTRDGSNYVRHVHGGDDYEVSTEVECNVSTVEWHSVDTYDPNPDNNEIRGPASSAPIPGGANAQFGSTTVSTTIRGHRVNWAPVEELYGWEVSHYELERFDEDNERWQHIAPVPAPPYYDTDEERGSSPRYRVRAVNVAGQEGPWAETGVSRTSGLPRLTLSLEPGTTIYEPDPDDPNFLTGDSIATVRATLNKVSGQDIPITVWADPATGSNPAEEGDFEVSENAKMMIPAGMLEAEGLVTITALADDDGDNERVSVSAAAAHVLPVDSVVLTIQDANAPDLTLSEDAVSVSESSMNVNYADYTVELDAQPSADVTVTLTTKGDITVQPDRLTFTADTWNTAQPVRVTAKQDHDTVGDTATVTHVARGSAEYPGIQKVLTVTITDDDEPGATVLPGTLDLIEGKAGKKYTVTLDFEPAGNVYINATSDNPDVRVSAPTFRLGRDNWRDGYTVTVSAGHDEDGEADTAMIDHRIDDARTTAGEYKDPANRVSVPPVTVRVSDDDAPGVTVSTQTLSIGEGRSGGYDVRLNTAPAGDVTVTVGSSNPDVSTEPASLVFTADNWNRGQRVTVHAGTDLDAADDTARLSHTTASPGDSMYQNLSGPTVDVSVRDPDRPGVTVGPLSPEPVSEAGRLVEVTEGEGDARVSRGTMRIEEGKPGFEDEQHPSYYTVRLDTRPTSDVVIAVKSDNPDKVAVHPEKLTFKPGDESLTKMVMVVGKDDADRDDEKATITHTVIAADSAAEYDGLSVASLNVIVDDNDNPGVTLIVCGAEPGLPCGPLVLSKDGTAKYQVVLDSQADGVIIVSIETSDPSKVKVEPEVLYFSGIQIDHGRTWPDWDEPQTVTVTALADGTVRLIHRIADANAHGWDVPIGAEVGRLTVRVE